MPTKRLPDSANLSHLKNQAKDLLHSFRSGTMQSVQRVKEFHPKFHDTPDSDPSDRLFSLSDALLTVAREYGYPSWPRLKQVIAEQHHQELTLTHNERLPDGPFRQALDFMDAGDADRLRRILTVVPDLVHQRAQFEGENYFTSPTLLEFLPENPFRQEQMPANAVEIAKILLEAGAKSNRTAMEETLGLAASGRICREYGHQEPLLQLLCAYGADPNSALHTALAHGELAAARTLIALGATQDVVSAAALNDAPQLRAFLADSTAHQRQLALALAATLGCAEPAKLLLEAGVDPNRFNPPGGHSHCTPLHSAAFAGHLSTVKALINGGARIDIGDIHHNATALDWAEHAGQTQVAAYLRRNQTS